MTDIKEEAKRLGCDIDGAEFANKMDKADSLASFRNEFIIPQRPDIAKNESAKQIQGDVIYLTGNSLGLQPKSTRLELDSYLNDWSRWGVEGHTKGEHPWISIDEQVQAQLSRVVGCEPSECCPMNSLSVNIHMMMIRFYRPAGQRTKIVIEEGAFPSDLYVTESQIRLHGYDPATHLIKISPRQGESILRTEDIEKVIRDNGSEIALVMFSGVQYYTGQLFNIEHITRVAHEVGAKAGWDLAHAAGNVVLKLHDWNVDFACWCSYKYINSGPGCIGGVFVHNRHTEGASVKDEPRFLGWFGNRLSNRFHKEMEFEPEVGALGFRCSNPSVADTTALRSSLSIFDRAGINNLRQKSLLLTGYLEYLLLSTFNNNANNTSNSVEIITPRDPNQRGCQLSLKVLGQINAVQLKHKLADSGVVCDVREPAVIRVAPTPLYNSFTDVYNFVNILKQSLNDQINK